MNDAKKRLAKNTTMMYFLNMARLIFPLLTLPYLTRVLSVDVYGVVAYSRACMGYAALLLDFGFMLSATREIIEAGMDRVKVSKVLVETTIGRLLLAVMGLIGIVVVSIQLPILNGWLWFMLISYLSVVMNIFLFDYYFRAIEQMQVITIRFVATRFVSVVLILLFVNSDADVLYIALFDSLSSLIGVLFSIYQVKNAYVSDGYYSVKSVFERLYLSAKYFVSTAAAQCFSGLNTILVGVLLTPVEVAYWSLSIQAVSVAQSFYDPIITSFYPYMLKNKDANLIKKTLCLTMPVLLLVGVLVYFIGPPILVFILGDKYQEVGEITVLLLPVIIGGFPAMLLGWPTLGSIKKVTEVTVTTVFSAAVQVLMLLFMYYFNIFSLLGVVITRNITEINLLLSRMYYCWKFRENLCGDGNK